MSGSISVLLVVQKGCYVEVDMCCVLWQVEEAKQELKDIVEFLKDPEKFTVLGAKLPKGEPCHLEQSACSLGKLLQNDLPFSRP